MAEELIFRLEEEDEQLAAKIRVVGLGGGGSNAVNRMIASRFTGVTFIVANTDAQALRTSPAPGSVSSIDKGVAPPKARFALLSHRVAGSRPPKVSSAIRVISATRTTRSEAAESRLRLSLISLCAVLSGVCRIPKMTFFGTSRYSTMSSTTRAPTPARMTSIFFAGGVSFATNDLKTTARFFALLRDRLMGIGCLHLLG